MEIAEIVLSGPCQKPIHAIRFPGNVRTKGKKKKCSYLNTLACNFLTSINIFSSR